MRAYNKWLLCDIVDEPAVTKSGMMLAASDVEEMRYQRGRVIAPPGDLVIGINEGDEVYFDKIRAFEMTLDGKRVTVINKDDIVGVV